MTSNWKDKLNWKNGVYKDDLKNSKTNYCCVQLQRAVSRSIKLSVAISRRKGGNHRQLAQKLSDPSVSSKTYWFIFEMIL